MPNMSHCMFENTVKDVRDCRDALDEMTQADINDMNEYERPNLREFIELCVEIAENHGDMDEYLELDGTDEEEEEDNG